MMQPACNGYRDELVLVRGRGFNLDDLKAASLIHAASRFDNRRFAAQPLMRTSDVVVVLDVITELSFQMLFVQDDNVIGSVQNFALFPFEAFRRNW